MSDQKITRQKNTCASKSRHSNESKLNRPVQRQSDKTSKQRTGAVTKIRPSTKSDKIKVVDVTRSFKTHISQNNIHYLMFENALYKYYPLDGHWTRVNDEIIKANINDFVEKSEVYRDHLNNNLIDNVYRNFTRQLRTECENNSRKKNAPLNKFLNEPNAQSNFVAFKDKVLDVDSYISNDIHYWLPLNQNFFTLNKVPIQPALEEKKEMPEYVKSILDNSFKTKESQLRFFEAAGLTLVGGRKSKSLFLIVGETGAGKTVLQTIIKSFLGADACSAIQYEDLTGEFSLIELVGNKANFCGELPAKTKYTNSKLETIVKQLTGGDTLSANEKLKPRFNFVFDGYLWLNSNFSFSISHDAMEARIEPILTKQVPKSKRIKGMDTTSFWEKRPQELEYLTYLIIEGYKRYIEQGGFTECALTKEWKEHQKTKSQPVYAFIKERFDITKNKSDYIDVAMIKAEYQKFHLNEYSKPTKITTPDLIDDITSNNEGVTTGMAKDKDTRKRIIRGVRFKGTYGGAVFQNPPDELTEEKIHQRFNNIENKIDNMRPN